MTYAQDKAGRLKNELYGMNRAASHEEVLETITEYIEEVMQAQREACAEVFKGRFANYNDVAIPLEEIRKEMEACLSFGILNAEVKI